MPLELESLDMERFQMESVVNYPKDNDFTRITEYKHFYFQQHPKTTISYEYSQSEGEPYYPIPRADNRKLYDKYKALTAGLKDTYFIGRLAQYRYINMDQAVDGALSLYDQIVADNSKS